jgi:protein-L-isoaspartate(D-aspartate) O-methyltransferase
MKTLLLLVLSMVAAAREATAQDAQCGRERAAMVETIRAYARSDASVLGQQGLSERVLEAMGQTKRHLFTPERSCSIAYADRPIPIGLGQTMSQPFIVALMTQLAEVAPDHVVLEVGTGSGYQAAILAHLARTVCTIEIIPSLAGAAAKALRDLAYDNVSVRLGDGYDGWPECGPFDAIVVTAALGQLPPPLGLIELKEDQWFDPHASGLKVLPHDVAIKSREALRDGILTVKKAQAVFITLGMTESWLDKSTGMVMNQNPGAAFLRKFGDRFEFIDYSFSEVLKKCTIKSP